MIVISTPVTSDESLARSQGVRVMDIPTEQKPEPERTVEKKRFAQRGIGLDHAGVDAEVAAFEQAVAVKRAQDELERRLEDLRAEPAADDRKAGVVGRFLFKSVAEEGTQRERVGTAAGDRTLARAGGA